MVNVAIVSALIVLSVAITFLNSGCLYAIFVTKRERRLSSLLVASLLVTHIIQGLVVLPLYTAKRWKIENKAANALICDSFRFSYLVTNYVSCITVLLISLDRFFAIRFPLKYRVRANKSCALKSITASWFYVLLLCLIPFIDHSKECNYNPPNIWVVTMLSCNTMLPFLIIIIVYIYISRKSRMFVKNCRKRRMMQRSEKVPKQKKRALKSLTNFLSKEFATAKMAVIIATSYIICWGPSFMYYFLRTTCEHCFAPSFKGSKTKDDLNYVMKFLTLVDGLVAPVIYCLYNRTIMTSFGQRMSRHHSRLASIFSTYNEANSTTSSTPMISKRRSLSAQSTAMVSLKLQNRALGTPKLASACKTKVNKSLFLQPVSDTKGSHDDYSSASDQEDLGELPDTEHLLLTISEHAQVPGPVMDVVSENAKLHESKRSSHESVRGGILNPEDEQQMLLTTQAENNLIEKDDGPKNT